MSWLADKFPEFAQALRSYRCTSETRGKGSCPNTEAHRNGDRHHSLVFQLADNGGLIFSCLAGCTKGQLLAAAGLRWGDVCVDKPEYLATGPKRRVPMRTLVTKYEYRRPMSEGSTVEYEVLRYFPKDFRPRREMPGHPGEYAYRLLQGHVVRVPSLDRAADPSGFKWVESRNVKSGEEGSVYLEAVRPTLYNSDLLSCFAPAEKILLWVEGERDANELVSLGFLATTVQGGANHMVWNPEWSAQVRGRLVLFLPDNDTPGVEYAAWYSGCCQMAGAAGVGTVRLPGLKHTGDVSDWLFANRESQQDRGPKSALARKLRGILAQANVYTPQKLYSAFGLSENPVEGHANPQPVRQPNRESAERAGA